jgi:hypothetical protein
MTELPHLTPPQGVQPGHVGLILLGRVIVGDISATMVDLALRQHIRVEESPHIGWLVSRPTGGDRQSLADHEKTLVLALPAAPVPINKINRPVLEDMRKALIRDGVAHGWLHRLHHDRRTPAADEVATHLKAFRRQMRQAQRDHGQEALGALLPYALRFGLATADVHPLAGFTHHHHQPIPRHRPGRNVTPLCCQARKAQFSRFGAV